LGFAAAGLFFTCFCNSRTVAWHVSYLRVNTSNCSLYDL
jgi:hypothetical protein